MILGKLENHMQKNETRLQFVLIKDLNTRSERINYIEENISTKLWTLVLEGFYELNPNVKGNKGKKK